MQITSAEKEILLNDTLEFSNWLDEKLSEQEKLSPMDTPAVSSTEIKKEMNKISKFSSRLRKRPAPTPTPSPKSKSKSKSKSEKSQPEDSSGEPKGSENPDKENVAEETEKNMPGDKENVDVSPLPTSEQPQEEKSEANGEKDDL